MNFCPACGTRFTEAGWPRKCLSCDHISYRNPIPVAVTLVPVTDRSRTGLLVVKRGIPPQIGQLALPGGYMEIGESWEDACAREVREESGHEVDPSGITLLFVRTSPKGLLLIFGRAMPIQLGDWLQDFKPNSEVQALGVIWEPRELAFPFHSEAANRFFTPTRR
jgi:8-oxo-dGTP pyrophosphatase MutT (NUDIX family)